MDTWSGLEAILARHPFSELTAYIKTTATLLASLLLTLTAAAEGDFARTLTPEEIQAAGLNKLTSGELQRLDALVQRYKAGEIATAAAAPKAPAEAPKAKSSKILPAWVGALVTLQRSGEKQDKSDAMEDHIKGDFSGWSGRTTFRLDNGQLWTQANSDSYIYAPTLKSPKVKIYPASFGTYWLEIEGVNQRCRVKPVKLE